MHNNRFYIMTLGCQMNISDSERIETKLKELGYKSASEKEADLVVVNSCSVRQKGIDRIWGGIKKWRALNKKILITGCVLESDRKKYADRGIDFLHIDDLPNLNKKLEIDKGKNSEHYLEIIPEFSGKIAYIPIMTGCDNFCSYCAVPYTRGREVSRKTDDIITECKNAINGDFKEIWLLGQNVNSYNPVIASPQAKQSMTGIQSLSIINDGSPRLTPRDDNNRFTELLKKVDNLPGDFKFNFISSNPQDMGDELIDTFANLKKWTKELHLAMQSGDDEILKKMNRKCTSDQFLDLVDKLKNSIDDLKLSTDIIVGFPSETKEQFNNTVKACKEIGFWKAYVNQYSPREGTVSAKITDDVPTIEKKRRWLVLDKLINHK